MQIFVINLNTMKNICRILLVYEIISLYQSQSSPLYNNNNMIIINNRFYFKISLTNVLEINVFTFLKCSNINNFL